MEKIGAVIITFNPVIKQLKRNIASVKENIGDNFIIVDNGSCNEQELKKEFETDNLLLLGSNKGIGKAQNVGFDVLEKKGFEWVLLLDQDSVIPSKTVEKLKATKQFSEKSTGIIALSIGEKGTTNRGVVKKNDVIASGSFIRMNAWKKAGGMDEELFIDYVDFDFDARVVEAGYLIYQDTNIIMEHEIGESIYAPIRGKMLLMGKRKGIFSDHSPIRLFYFYRNSIIVKKRYPNFFTDKRNPIFLNIRRLREILVYRKPVIKKLRYAIKGIIEGIKYSPDRDQIFTERRNRTHDES